MKTLRLILLMLLSIGVLAGKALAVEVFVSIGPQKWLVEQIGREQVKVEVLVRSGQDPHTFEPLPRQVAALSKAAIWYTLDLEFEKPLIDKIRSVAPSLTIVDMSQEVVKLPIGDHGHGEHAEDHGAGESIEHDQAADHDDHADVADHNDHGHHADGADHDDHGHHGEQYDPHVWLSPVNLQVMGHTVAKSLAAVAPDHQDYFAANLAETETTLTVLDEQLQTLLAPYAGASFFVFHPSFGYFANSYKLVQQAVEIQGKSPGPKQLASLIARAKASGVKVIFVQPQFDPKSAEAVAAAIGGQVVPLDALAEDVTGNLTEMAAKIEGALKP